MAISNHKMTVTTWLVEFLNHWHSHWSSFSAPVQFVYVGHLTMKERLHCSNNLFETEENVQTWAFRMTCSFSLMSLLCNIWVVHCIISKRKFFPENPISRIRTVTHKKCEKIPVISLSSSSCLSFVNTTSCPSLLKAWREREMEKRNLVVVGLVFQQQESVKIWINSKVVYLKAFRAIGSSSAMSMGFSFGLVSRTFATIRPG